MVPTPEAAATSVSDGEAAGAPDAGRQGPGQEEGRAAIWGATPVQHGTLAMALEATRQGHAATIRWRTWWRHGRHAAAPIDPLTVLEVAPDSIRRAARRAARRAVEGESPHVPGVVGGDWDRETVAVPATRRVRRVREYLRETAGVQASSGPGAGSSHTRGEGVPVDSTEQVGAGDGSGPTETGDPQPTSADGGVGSPSVSPSGTDGFASGDSRSLAALEWVFADVATGGYRSVAQRRAARSVPVVEPTVFDPYPRLPAAMGEIRVAIGRDGQLVLLEGHERLAVAGVLGVASVPVFVAGRHERWQRRREEVVLTGIGGEHPDLEGL